MFEFRYQHNVQKHACDYYSLSVICKCFGIDVFDTYCPKTMFLLVLATTHCKETSLPQKKCEKKTMRMQFGVCGGGGCVGCVCVVCVCVLFVCLLGCLFVCLFVCFCCCCCFRKSANVNCGFPFLLHF